MKWSEIRNDNYEQSESMDKDSFITIDAWLTEDDNEEGKVIARINCGTKEVIYYDNDAKTDIYAQEMIKEVLDELNKVDL